VVRRGGRTRHRSAPHFAIYAALRPYVDGAPASP
jgi:hypothetical protein